METSTRRWPLLDRLRAHKGGLVRIRSQLCWYGGRGGWDGVPGRLCVLLDATADPAGVRAAATAHAGPATAVAALLLIDGAPHWVWMAVEDIELLDGGDR